MKRKHRNLISLFCFSLAFSGYSQKVARENVESLINSVPRSAYEKVATERLLADTLYLKMLEEGWSMEEILRVTDGYVSENIKELKGNSEFALYAKQLRPVFFGNEAMTQQIIPDAISPEVRLTEASVRRQYRNADEYFPRQFYDPASRFTRRDPGLFKHMNVQPAGGRVEWMTLHPDDPDKLMVKPDGDGIWRTDDMGRTWDCVTDRIPDRYHRNEVEAHAIPVDPDDWNHFYAFPTNGNPVYQTTDGGESWRQIQGATHKGFKRGHAFRDARGKLKFIGANPNSSWDSKLWISEDTCKTWRQITMPADQMD
ncbi:MAG: WD40/YVTN/BNR-like repeat-containing protein, partial [Bacteroidales bacterium]